MGSGPSSWSSVRRFAGKCWAHLARGHERKQHLDTLGKSWQEASALDLRARHALHTQPPFPPYTVAPLPRATRSRRTPLHRTALTAEYAARLPQVPSSQRRRDTPTSSWGECSLHPYFARIPSKLVTQPTHTRRPALHRAPRSLRNMPRDCHRCLHHRQRNTPAL